MKALGKDIWDFYLNGWPEGYSHDTYGHEVAYWPGYFNDPTGAYSLLEDDKEYDLNIFGVALHDVHEELSISFEDAYLAWKGIEKPKSITFNEWFNENYPFEDVGESFVTAKDYFVFKGAMRQAWAAGVESIKEVQ